MGSLCSKLYFQVLLFLNGFSKIIYLPLPDVNDGSKDQVRNVGTDTIVTNYCLSMIV